MEDTMQEGMLSPYRVLDLTDNTSLLCGKILGDLGADVIKVERPGGDPAREIGPFYKDEIDLEKSLFWFVFNTSKRGITLDIERAEGQEIFKKIVNTADFVIESSQPGHMETLGLGYESLEKVNPRIIVTSITPFGHTGPYAHWKGSDIAATAMGGLQWLCGDADRPPVRFTTQAAYFETSVQAASGTMIAHFYRERTGEGQHVDVSMQEAISNTLDTAGMGWHLAKQVYRRAGGARYFPPMNCIYPCKDGHFARWTPEDVPDFLNWLEKIGSVDPDLKEEYMKGWNEAEVAGTNLAYFWGVDKYNKNKDISSKLLESLTKRDIQEAAKAHHFGWGPCNTVKEVLESEQLKSRNWFVQLEHPELGQTLTYPGVPLKLSETPFRLRRRAPLIGEHNEEIYVGELGFSKQDIMFLKRTGVI